jgi:hypothetical protein
MSRGTTGRPKPPTIPTLVPVRVTIHAPLLDAVRARYPAARDWPDGRVVAACVALALKTRTHP